MKRFDPHIEDQILQAVSGPNLMDLTTNIARWVRLSGEPDELLSFQWIQTKLEEYGYRTELVHHEGYISLPGPARMVVEGAEIESPISHAFCVSTPEEGISGELAYVPDPTKTDPALVRGRIALVPGMASGTSTLALEAAGAIAQVYIHDDYLHESSTSPIWGNPTPETIGRMPTTPGIAIRQADGLRLKERLATQPVTATVYAKVETGWRQIPLLSADLPGVDSQDFLLLSSHIDSWYYGAMDNGSANATAMEVARLLAQHKDSLRRGLRLAFWSGHSHGRFAGSAWYADRHWQELRDRCVGHVFVDSTGGMGAVVVTEPPIMPETRGVASEALLKVAGEVLEGKRIGRFADQSFYGVGLPSTFGTFSEQAADPNKGGISFKTGGKRAGGLGWWWHTPYDTVDKVDEAFLVRDTRVYASAVYRILSSPVLPYDYREAVRDLQATVADLEKAAAGRFDLTPLTRGLTELSAQVSRFYEGLSAASESEVIAGAANQAIMDLARHLVPINFHENGLFDHDPMEALQPIPALKGLRRLAALPLDSDEYYLLLTRVRRQYNWVLSELKAASRAATEGIRAVSR